MISFLHERNDEYKWGSMTKEFNYGTAGFREKDDDLPVIMYRMGILAAIRSLSQKGQAIGVMITASHNPEGDNGVKLIDPHGEMLDSNWESTATFLVNANDNFLESTVNEILSDYNIPKNGQFKALVHCAHDTRKSSLGLLKAVEQGVSCVIDSIFICHGFLTTPQLHYIIKSSNSGSLYGEPNEDGYINKFSNAFNKLSNLLTQSQNKDTQYQRFLYVDAANGIGGPNFLKLVEFLDKSVLNITFVNVNEGSLNKQCGADFVKTERKCPKIYTSGMEIAPNQKCCSFDGDADRLVYYFVQNDGSFRLLDGDKIAVLFADFIDQLLKITGLQNEFSIGIVQTAYANGNSTQFIEENFPHLKVYCVSTGVKHLHKQAEALDVGIYFEANGHGTVLFSDKMKQALHKLIENRIDSHACQAAEQFLAFIDLVNEAVGDAIADLLCVETILRFKNWSLYDWDSVYTDIPSKHWKVKVADRRVIQTANAERTCTAPVGLQKLIDTTVATFSQGRAFIRASGTEDIVRIYAEADTLENSEKLAILVACHVFDLANGIGDRPIC